MECYLAKKEGNPAICCNMDWTLAVLCKVKQVEVKLLSCVRLSVTPGTVACQAPLSMRFSKQEYWRGLPFPSPGDLPNPGIKPRSPALQVDSFAAEPPGKPKNTGVGSLSLLQRIFPTQESNWGLLHCRRLDSSDSLPTELSWKPCAK